MGELDRLIRRIEVLEAAEAAVSSLQQVADGWCRRALAAEAEAARLREVRDQMGEALERAEHDILASYSGNPGKWPNHNETIRVIDAALRAPAAGEDG